LTQVFLFIHASGFVIALASGFVLTLDSAFVIYNCLRFHYLTYLSFTQVSLFTLASGFVLYTLATGFVLPSL
jgi:hypothetical protein